MSTMTIPDLTTGTDGAPGDEAALTIADLPAPDGRVRLGTAVATVAGRTLRQFWRTPQLIVVGSLTSAMFLLIFRYVFGGAIQTGGVSYVDFLIPALAVSAGLFASGGVGVADDIESGFIDRLRSLPIPRSSILIGRSLANTVLVAWSALTTLALGFATGFRFHGGVPSALAALGLCLIFGAALTWPFIYMGLISGSAEAAQSMSFLAFPFVFVSSAYVPVASMPGWLQPVAEHQPITQMVGAVRALTLGDEAHAVLGHSAAWFTVRALIWAVVIAVGFGALAARRFARASE
jgi:ABC-2 type transport system permease protein